MPIKVLRFDPTPNPNAVKCVLDRPIVPPDKAPRSYRDASAAVDDPLASAIFAIDPLGAVTGVLMNADWITVNKSPDADWPALKTGVKRVLAGAD